MWRGRVALITVLATVVTAGVATDGAIAAGPNASITGDLDGDGLADRVTLVDIAPDECGVVVEPGLVGGGFDLPTAHVYDDPPGAGTPDDCPDVGTMLDLRGDGSVDLMVGWSTGRPAGSEVDLLLLRDFAPSGGFLALPRPDYIGSAHLNVDLRRDIYEWSEEDRAFATYLNSPGGALVPGPMRFCGSGLAPKLADLNRSGAVDAVISYTGGCADTSSGVVVLLDSGATVQLQQSPTGTTRWTAVPQDVNADGTKDVVTRDTTTGAATYHISDGRGGFTDAPVANDDTASTIGTKKVGIPVLANDISTTTAKVTIVTPPTHGTVQVTTSQTVVYTPNGTHGSTDNFVYRLSIDGRSDNAAVAIRFRRQDPVASPPRP
ncbi:hypothetical protein I0C86_30820 [Plantactinospora sp. S1510]|uniref:VCBS repeat-containing protein n=1 Tax=Plantactinospora alkalitolerans TaxID=2789879 RepID=A0ABS0H4D7_9ACTN|nr:Ig-like domain-containing protein [Plantactinospora alkalitolerans]MBF9133324.1 hypothetical protein [Plantactinospora alkalitolerans]